MKVFLSYARGDRQLAQQLILEFRRLGNEVLDATDVAPGADVFSSMEAQVRSVDAFVGLLGNGGPNLYFELGLAAGAGKPIVIAATRTSRIPSNIETFPLVTLTDDLEVDARRIARRVNEAAISRTGGSSAPTGGDRRDRSFDAAEFEGHVSELLELLGFRVHGHPQHTDPGYDLIAETEDGRRVLVELKRWSSQQRIPLTVVQSLATAVSQTGSGYGLLVSTAPFTAAAVELASKSSVILKSLEDLSSNVSVEQVLRPTSSSILQISADLPAMPIVKCQIGQVVLPLNLDTGSASSFGDDAAFVSSGTVPEGEELDYQNLAMSIGGQISPVFARKIDVPVAVVSEDRLVPAQLRILLVRDWHKSPLANVAPIGLIGRSFLADNDLTLTLVGDVVIVARTE